MRSLEPILIHIGYHKTASSWLQDQLFVRDSPYFLPLSHDPKGQSSFSNGFIRTVKGPILSPFDSNEPYLKAELDALLNTLPDAKGRCYVVTNERLAGSPENAGLDARSIADRLHAFFPTAKVLIMIREQRSFIFSNYFEYLEQGGVHGIRNYLYQKEDVKRPHFSPAHVEYLPLIRYYDSLFGAENVIVHTLEQFKQDPQLLLRKLSEATGQDIQLNPTAFAHQVNVKQHHFARYRFRYLNYFIWSRAVNHYSSLHSRTAKRIALRIWWVIRHLSPRSWDRKVKRSIQNEIDAYCSGRFEKSNRLLAERLSTDLSAYGYGM